ncbi:MAG: acetate kinase [Porphyromonadaceae bacterium]|nr:acetate kinase [Porphyromonadaceae bacterium]
MKILVLNCGSSSVKYKLFDMNQKVVLATGVVEKIGMKGSFLKHTREDGQQVILEGEVLEHQVAIEYILGVLTSKKHGCLKDIDEIKAVGHRVVHGGEKFNSSVVLTEEVIKNIESCIEIAPLHNPPNLSGIYAINELLPSVPQVAVFDTAFHQTMPDYAYMYGIPYSLYKKYGIRRYGFHGTSHRYVSQRACEFLKLECGKTKVITAHIGNGASITAVENGKSIDTSMGFTPVEGLIMGTRSGDVDLGVVTYIMDKEMIGTAAANTLFNKHSGILGVSGLSSDMRDIDKAINEGNERAKLALDMYEYRIKKYIGAFAAALNGFDVLVFTGGVGENQITTRDKVCKGLSYLGIELDPEKNKIRGEEVLISTPNSKVKVVVIPTDEELMIATDTMDLVW